MRYLSLFSGIEAAHVAWHPLGWQCVGVAEIDSGACKVLAHRLPNVPNLGSVTEITDAQVSALGHIDVVIGGSPCQDLSIAGRRAGLAGARSGLFHEQCRIFDAARTLCGARWCVWENVPGAFSSNAGRDFAVVVGALAGCNLDVPADGWGSEGVALGDNGLVEWAVLDAQWFGLAQRRSRVFAVLDTGNWIDRSPVLLERDSLRGDSAPSREAWEGASTNIGGGPDEGRIAGSVTSKWAKGSGGPAGDECYNMVTHTLRADGFGASEDGTGRGTPLVPVAQTFACSGCGEQIDPLWGWGQWCDYCGHDHGPNPIPFDTTQITSAANYSNPKPGDPCHPLAAGMHPPAIAFGCKDSDTARGLGDDVAPTLRAMQHDSSHANAGGQVAVAISENQQSHITESDVMLSLKTGGGKPGQSYPAIRIDMQVRRLTPRECERLQGFPDDWTLVPTGKRMAADGPRYRQLGNSFAVPVVRWIGEQIERATRESEQQAAA